MYTVSCFDIFKTQNFSVNINRILNIGSSRKANKKRNSVTAKLFEESSFCTVPETYST